MLSLEENMEICDIINYVKTQAYWKRASYYGKLKGISTYYLNPTIYNIQRDDVPQLRESNKGIVKA